MFTKPQSRSILCLHLPRHIGSIGMVDWNNAWNSCLRRPQPRAHLVPLTPLQPLFLRDLCWVLLIFPVSTCWRASSLLRLRSLSGDLIQAVALNRTYTLMILKLNLHPDLCSELQTNIFNRQLNIFTWIPDLKLKRPELSIFSSKPVPPRHVPKFDQRH